MVTKPTPFQPGDTVYSNSLEDGIRRGTFLRETTNQTWGFCRIVIQIDGEAGTTETLGPMGGYTKSLADAKRRLAKKAESVHRMANKEIAAHQADIAKYMRMKADADAAIEKAKMTFG